MAAEPFTRTPYRIRPLARIILFKMYAAYVNTDDKVEMSSVEIKSLFDEEISSNLINSALGILYGETYSSQRLVSRHGNKAGPYKYRITNNGIGVVERALLKKNSDLSYFREHGEEALYDIAGLEGIFFTSDERQDISELSPIQIDRDTEEFADTVQALEEAIEEIRKNNTLAAHYPSQKAGVLQSLEDGLAWLKEKAPTMAQMRALIISPLTWIATTFGKETLGQLAKTAAQKVADYIISLL